jgi:hypothetical protein
MHISHTFIYLTPTYFDKAFYVHFNTFLVMRTLPEDKQPWSKHTADEKIYNFYACKNVYSV